MFFTNYTLCKLRKDGHLLISVEEHQRSATETSVAYSKKLNGLARDRYCLGEDVDDGGCSHGAPKPQFAMGKVRL